MTRWITIIAIVSIGLNIGLASAVAFGVWHRTQAVKALDFPHFQGDDKGPRIGHGGPGGALGTGGLRPERRPNGRIDGAGGTRPPRPNNLRELQKNLELTPVQRNAFRALLDSRRTDRQNLNASLKDNKDRLAQALGEDDIDFNHVMALYQESLDARENTLKSQVGRSLDFYKTLSVEQRATIRTWSNGNILGLLE